VCDSACKIFLHPVTRFGLQQRSSCECQMSCNFLNPTQLCWCCTSYNTSTNISISILGPPPEHVGLVVWTVSVSPCITRLDDDDDMLGVAGIPRERSSSSVVVTQHYRKKKCSGPTTAATILLPAQRMATITSTITACCKLLSNNNTTRIY
jgi:hypothetical protein